MNKIYTMNKILSKFIKPFRCETPLSFGVLISNLIGTSPLIGLASIRVSLFLLCYSLFLIPCSAQVITASQYTRSADAAFENKNYNKIGRAHV